MISEGGPSGLRSAETGSSETNGSHLSAAGGDEYRYVLTVRPGGKEIWSAHVFRGSRWVCFLARGLVEHEQNAADEIEDVRGLVVRHIDSLR